MAWWRERLEELDEAARGHSEPRLDAVRTELVERGLTGLELSRLEDAWLPMLEPFPWGESAVRGFDLRGRILFNLGARLLGGDAGDAEAAGALWSLVDGATHCSDAGSRQLLSAAARSTLDEVPQKLPLKIRPITILAALAAYDLRPGGGLGRGGAAIAHRLLGTVRHS